MTSLRIPAAVAYWVPRWFGDRGREWLRALPAVVAGLADRWQLTLGTTPFDDGSHSVVLPATLADGRAAVLKVPVVDDENREEAAALRHYDGDGAVWLYEADTESGALLLERAEPGTPLADFSDRAAAIDMMCGLLRRLWRPLPRTHDFPLVRDLALRWATELTEDQRRLGNPLPAALVAEAAEWARELATPDGPVGLVNRDAHLRNVLAASREPWLLIDPKPLAGDRVFDTGHLLVNLLGDNATGRDASELVARLASQLAVDPARVRGWALVRAVDNAMWRLDVGVDPAADVATATAVAAVRST